jgi:signal transduction histidine kinase
VSASTNLAALEMQEGNKELSNELSKQALETAKKSKLYFAIPNIYLGKAFYELKAENFAAAHQMLDSAQQYSNYSSYSEIMPPLLHLRYRVYEESGDFKQALETYKEKTAVNDSIDEIGNAKLLSELQFKYDDEKKERLRSIEKNKLKLELKQQEVDMTKFRQNVIIGLAVGVFVVLVLIVMYFRLKQKSDNLFSFTIANKLEEERGRIARDLHDGLGQSLIILKNKFNNINLDNPSEAEQVNENFSEVIEEVRSISRSLIPPELKRLGLKKAIENMCQDVESNSHLIVTTEIEAIDECGFEDHQAIRVYRILQELVTNTIKHSRASSLKIAADKKAGELEIVYQDNGTGLDIQQFL